jgi:hypothetical protein
VTEKHPMKTIARICAALALILLAGCSAQEDGHSVFRFFSVKDGSAAVRTPGLPDALVTANGDLSIAGKPVAVEPQQRDLLKRYYAAILALHEQTVAIGAAGAATGTQAVSSVLAALTSGNPDKIDQEVNAKAAQVETEVARLCADLGEIRRLQTSLAEQVPDLKPYATITADLLTNCRVE